MRTFLFHVSEHAGGNMPHSLPFFCPLAQKRQELNPWEFALDTTAGKHTVDWILANAIYFCVCKKSCCREQDPNTRYSAWCSKWFRGLLIRALTSLPCNAFQTTGKETFVWSKQTKFYWLPWGALRVKHEWHRGDTKSSSTQLDYSSHTLYIF